MTNQFDAKAFLANLTTLPGVYQMLNAQDDVLYVGKARNLKNRISSYFQSSGLNTKTAALVKQIHDIKIIVTHSESEAFLLENNLIKKLQPHYNILLRDDKSYPYIYLSNHADFPRLTYHRGAKQEQGRYFGPYTSAGAVYESLNILQKIFKIRSCQDTFFQSRTRPCLQYQIKRCTAPCVKYIEPAAYQQDVRNAELFLEGKCQTILSELAKKMETASTDLNFEEAARYRDQIASLRRIQEQQYMVNRKGDVDIIALATQAGVYCAQILFVRGGRMLDSKSYFPKVPPNTSEAEVLEAFLSQYYLQTAKEKILPEHIIININFDERAWLETALSEYASHAVAILHKVRGERLRWLQMAEKNAKQSLGSYLADKANNLQRMEALQQFLQLDNLPQRIECFDVSHTMGNQTVASCVVFDSNGPVKADYRRFNISGITEGDDYAAMKQALQRRYKRVKEHEGKLPDILIIDGGKGQLAQAEAVLEELQLTGSITLLGIAKGVARKPGLETLLISGKNHPLVLEPDSMALHVLQQIRDEAHRFAITGHRARRAKASTVSTLENIPGIGAMKRRELLRRFGGLQEVSRASIEELAKTKGISKELAQRIYEALHGV